MIFCMSVAERIAAVHLSKLRIRSYATNHFFKTSPTHPHPDSAATRFIEPHLLFNALSGSLGFAVIFFRYVYLKRY
jgi:hypothetical protein